MSGKRRRMITVGVRLPPEVVELIDKRLAKWNRNHRLKRRSDYLRPLIIWQVLRGHHKKRKRDVHKGD